uniref:Indoleamine 2,3-dioxygenase 2 n=1 Tax=Strigops habroptila TaxID=2489341 RepID=A0A672UFM3_STRHB
MDGCWWVDAGTWCIKRPPSPLSTKTELPAPYGPWMEIAHNLPQLITSHQLRSRVHQVPLSFPALKLSQMSLSSPVLYAVQVLPRNLAVPFWEVSQALGLPPILSHADFVLANWRRKNPNGNLDTIISLPGGESLRGFILVTLLVEKAAVPGFKVGITVPHSVLLAQKPRVSACSPPSQPLCSLPDCCVSLLSWKDNPAMPDGLIYEGVSDEPMEYSGGSAAQSTILHAFDELLGIRHTAFLHRMRDYMPPPHRAFVEEIRRAPSLKQHVLSSRDTRLHKAFNQCVSALADFRSYHITVVTKYITIAATKAKAGQAEPGGKSGSSMGKPPSALEAKGTGGSHIFSFLKSIRDTTREGMINA